MTNPTSARHVPKRGVHKLNELDTKPPPNTTLIYTVPIVIDISTVGVISTNTASPAFIKAQLSVVHFVTPHLSAHQVFLITSKHPHVPKLEISIARKCGNSFESATPKAASQSAF